MMVQEVSDLSHLRRLVLLSDDSSQGHQFLENIGKVTNKRNFLRMSKHSQAATFDSEIVQSLASVDDRETRIKKLRHIERELKQHFKYGFTDVITSNPKSLLASRAFEADHLRQLAFEKKIESYYKETNQYEKLREFQTAKAATMISAQSVTMNESAITKQKSEEGLCSFQFVQSQRRVRQQSKEIQKKHELILQQQVMLSLSPRLSSEDPLGKLVRPGPTVIGMANSNVPPKIIQNRQRKRVEKFTQRRKQEIKKPVVDPAIKGKSIHLGQKLGSGQTEERFEHERTIATPSIESKSLTRGHSSKPQKVLQAFATVNNIKFIAPASDTQRPLSKRRESQHELDVRVVQTRDHTAQASNGLIAPYTAWNNQTRNMPMKVQLQVCQSNRRYKSARLGSHRPRETLFKPLDRDLFQSQLSVHRQYDTQSLNCLDQVQTQTQRSQQRPETAYISYPPDLTGVSEKPEYDDVRVQSTSKLNSIDSRQPRTQIYSKKVIRQDELKVADQAIKELEIIDESQIEPPKVQMVKPRPQTVPFKHKRQVGGQPTLLEALAVQSSKEIIGKVSQPRITGRSQKQTFSQRVGELVQNLGRGITAKPKTDSASFTISSQKNRLPKRPRPKTGRNPVWALIQETLTDSAPTLELGIAASSFSKKLQLNKRSPRRKSKVTLSPNRMQSRKTSVGPSTTHLPRSRSSYTENNFKGGKFSNIDITNIIATKGDYHQIQIKPSSDRQNLVQLQLRVAQPVQESLYKTTLANSKEFPQEQAQPLSSDFMRSLDQGPYKNDQMLPNSASFVGLVPFAKERSRANNDAIGSSMRRFTHFQLTSHQLEDSSRRIASSERSDPTAKGLGSERLLSLPREELTYRPVKIKELKCQQDFVPRKIEARTSSSRQQRLDFTHTDLIDFFKHAAKQSGKKSQAIIGKGFRTEERNDSNKQNNPKNKMIKAEAGVLKTQRIEPKLVPI